MGGDSGHMGGNSEHSQVNVSQRHNPPSPGHTNTDPQG